jgi:Ser/Thr protein kinase RdoA (MazF antagonist)
MTDATAGTPFAALDPDFVLGALDAVGLRGDGRLLQLNSYENRVYQVYLEGGRIVVAKFYRPARWTDAQILEEHAFAGELAAAEIPVAAPLVLAPAAADPRLRLAGPTLGRWTAASASYRFAVADRASGREPELDDADVLERIGAYLGRIHAVGGKSAFRERMALNVQTFGRDPRDWLLQHDAVPAEAVDAWRGVVDQALDRAQSAFDAVLPLRTLRLHGDCHPGNILWSAQGPCFVDLDDAATGPAVQDLWMLLSGDRAAMARQLDTVLGGYEQFRGFDRRELALIEPLRTLRMIHHSAWIARRWDDPAFPIAFPFFESPSYWAQETTRLREQLEAMAEPPLD